MPIRDDDEQGLSPIPVSLTSVQIVEAVARSPDGGNTLFLSKLGLSDIGANEATELAHAGRNSRHEKDSTVERLALGNNRLATLPTEFALLTHLRYLNLRHNSFPSFPEVLTLMPSLDTLDISYNKIKTLPPYPGNLTRLRVFSFSRNKVTRLPTYLTQFRQLEVMQCDRNPIDWPPLSVMETWGDSQDIKHGKEWVRSLQGWMEADGSNGREFDDSGYSEQPDWGDERSYYDSWRFPAQDTPSDLSLTPHARSFSIDSDTSSILNPVVEEPVKPASLPKHRPLNLTTNGKSAIRLPDHLETLSASPYGATLGSKQTYDLIPEPEAMHLRTASHASPLPRKTHTVAVAGKKSLPDLRTTKDGRKGLSTTPERRSPNNVKTPNDRLVAAIRQDSGSSSGSLPPAYDDEVPVTNPRVMPLVAVERSSYFKRSSVIPANHSLPKALLVLLESARGILFSMGQLYQTLDQYVHHGSSDRLAGVFKKVLDPTNITMLHLIRSLDRFDDVSQKSSPSAAVCRALVESCRDTVNVFRKAVALLSAQVTPEGSEDTRYVRWLILELYAASAELSHSWQALVSQLDSLRPFLSPSNFLRTTSFTTPPIAEVPNGLVLPSDQLAPPVRLRPIDTGTPAGRTRTARRHAGSFSTKDVQMGKELPSYDILPSIPSGLASPSQTPTIRTPKRMMTTPIISTPTPNSSTSSSFNAPSYFGSLSESATHQRGLSQSSLPDGSFSPSIIHDSPAATNFQNEKNVLQAVDHAVKFAPAVWDQIEEALDAAAVNDQDIQETIEQARSVTKRLADNVAVMSEGYSEVDKRLLRENAHLFLKTLLHLSNVLKTYGTPRSVPAALRANMVKLNTATQEFSLLLQVSSAPSHTPHTYSPTIPNSKYAPYNHPTSAPAEDNQLPFSLSRSRSEQPSLQGRRTPLTASYDNLRNALPLPSAMKSSGVRRLRLPREISTEATDPG